jgi:hypothetical protein
MVTRNDWVTPFANGFPANSPSKALDRAIAVSYKLFGVADWTARLPIAFCVLFLALTVFYFGRRAFGWNAAGFYAALAVLVWPGTFLATRNLGTAPLLCLGTALVALILWDVLVSKRLALGNAIAVTAAASALILLTCDAPGVLLPLAIVVLCWLARRVVDPAKQATTLLGGWAVCALLLAGVFGRSPQAALTWFLPVPPLALLLGDVLARNEAFSHKTIGKRVAYLLFTLGLLLAATALFFAFSRRFGLTYHHGAVAFFVGRVPLSIAAAALVVGVAGNLLYRLRNRARIANCFLAGSLGGFIVAIQIGMVLASPWHSSQILANAIRPELNPTDLVVVDGKYQDASSFAFYLERPVLIVAPPAPVWAIAPPPLRGAVAINQVWAGSSRVFLWTSADHPLAVPGQSYVVASSGGKQILSNQRDSGGATF